MTLHMYILELERTWPQRSGTRKHTYVLDDLSEDYLSYVRFGS